MSFYYPPDIGPGPIRVHSLVQALMSLDAENKMIEIEVLTTLPNRYSDFRRPADKIEKHENLTIRRFAMPNHKNGFFDQCLAFCFYFFYVVLFSWKTKPDVVFVSSSRLMSCFLGSVISKLKRAHLFLDIRDIFSEAIYPILEKKRLLIIYPLIKLIERFAFNSASSINIVSGGFSEYMKKNAPHIQPTIFTHGVDKEFLIHNFQKEKSQGSLKILYVGNIGDGQAIQMILPDVAKHFGERVFFQIIGGGNKKNELIKKINNFKLTNVEVIDPVPRKDLFAFYKDADCLLCHLNDLTAFSKVLPSKLFEYAATGKPILAGVSGWARCFLETNVQGVKAFAPLDAQGMIDAINLIVKDQNHFDRSEFGRKFCRENISTKMALRVIELNQKK